MLSHRTVLKPALGCFCLTALFLLTAEIAGAQIPALPLEKINVPTSPTESGPGMATAKGTTVALDKAMDGPTVPTRSETDLMNAATDAPKVNPMPKPSPTPMPLCRKISADVVALPQPIMLNRLGATVPDGLIFALRSDTVGGNGTQLLDSKRPRPIVLRANVGDCLTITLKNQIPHDNFGTIPPVVNPGAAIGTTEVSIHVQGMEWVKGSKDDGTFVGQNNSSLASPAGSPGPQTQIYTLYAREEGTFLLYTMGDSSTTGMQLMRGLFGALNVEPAGAEWYRSQVTADDLALATYNAKSLPAGWKLNAGCTTTAPCTLKIAGKPSKQVFKTAGGFLQTSDHHPLINYNAKYANGTPILKMLDGSKIVHSDLTAIITGPNAGRFPGANGNPNQPDPPCNAENNAAPPVGGTVDPLFCQNPASPDRKQPYREVTIIYHEMMDAVTTQAFPVFTTDLRGTLAAGKDAFAINYGTGGISAEVYANRIGVGPMGDCIDCKFEEFFLSAWPVGDPAMLVDRPANTSLVTPFPPPSRPPTPPPPTLCTESDFEPIWPATPNPNCANTRQPSPPPPDPTAPYTLAPLAKATVAYYPDDPSNVYHSYINDHLKFRILHGGTGVSHVHHQHAHQWLQSPNSDQGSYLDSQMISPGASYTLEMVYNGSGNRNKVVGDSIFHCHFYPHFASGMWSMWRTHDTFEAGTYVYPKGSANQGKVVPGARALPDGEIVTGVPTPAIVPMPTIPMAPLPAYAQIQTNVKVEGLLNTVGGQVVIGGTCQGGKINGLDVIGGCTDGDKLNGTVLNSQFDGTNMTGQFQKSATVQNPGFPYFIPGIAGARPPHPPLDFAPDGAGGSADGGLPRHVISGGAVSYEQHSDVDWSKDLSQVNALKLPELGTEVEQAAMAFFGNRCYSTSFPDGTPGICPSSNSIPPQSTLNNPPTGFLLNGLPRKNAAGNSAEKLGAQHGAPFADPAVDDNGSPVGAVRTYKAAAIQLNVVFNKQGLGWHYPQHRMLTLWKDVQPSIDFSFGKAGGRPPEPLFFRGNSGDIVEYWHTNLVPNYYQRDDFQVRTPTDILGQHIHLVKFDVTSSDGAGNGFNYEDGTFSPQEVQETIKAINDSATHGFVNAPNVALVPKAPPKEILDCPSGSMDKRCLPCPDNWTIHYRPQCHSWLGAQTTIQRWYLDPLVDDSGVDRTLRTVFTHDHFGPSTHQQAGLYAGLVVEPRGSTWTSNDGLTTFGSRIDGGPTSWAARILTTNTPDSYREFLLEFQDFQLAYQVNKIGADGPKFPDATSEPNPNPGKGYSDPVYALGAPAIPTLISTQDVGTQSVNYRNEPVPWRAQIAPLGGGDTADLSNAFDSDIHPAISSPNPPFFLGGDPFTPLLRAYQGDKVQVRLLVGAHMFAHQFNLQGPRWFAEPSWKSSGYRSVQAMGLSEHFELLFNTPYSSRDKDGTSYISCPDGKSSGFCIDYLYAPGFDSIGLSNGLWGLFRSYDPTKAATGLKELPNNKVGPAAGVTYATCPASAPKKIFKITAVTAQQALAKRSPIPPPPPDPGDPNPPEAKGQIIFNDRDGGDVSKALRARLAIMYVYTDDLENGLLKGPEPPVQNGNPSPFGVPIEPLILRANAGDCIEVELTNGIPPNSDIFTQPFDYQAPLTGTIAPDFAPPRASQLVGIHPQLLSYDAASSNGFNVGHNRITTGGGSQIAKPNVTRKYTWYAGTIERDANGVLQHTPVEFGALNLIPSDPLFQNINGLFGQMIIEPKGSSWTCYAEDASGNPKKDVPCAPEAGFDPTKVQNYTRASATVTPPDSTQQFREFAVMISDDLRISQGNTSAVNYRTEPQSFRYPAPADNQDFSCMLSNQLVGGDPKTPLFKANVGDKVRFRMTHPFGTGTSQVFTLSGHVWQRNPYNYVKDATTQQDSQVIGNNKLSQWLGSHDHHGSSDHFDLVIDKAGGVFSQPGDYLYTVFRPSQVANGAWGVFRVGNSQVVSLPNGACPAPSAPAVAAPSAAPKEQFPNFIVPPTSKDPTRKP